MTSHTFPQWRLLRGGAANPSLVWSVVFLALMGLALWAGLGPSKAMPQLFWPWGGPVSDKVLHAAGFMALGMSACLAGGGAIVATVALALFGVGLELAQAAMGLGRTADVRDALANAAGLAAAFGVMAMLAAAQRAPRPA